MNLNELRDRAYKTACEHGFHDEELSNEHCLCLVISELMEAVEADRKSRRAKVDWYKKKIKNSRICNGLDPNISKEVGLEVAYKETIKGTIEEELADVVIRLLDLAGIKQIYLPVFERINAPGWDEEAYRCPFTEFVYHLCQELLDECSMLDVRIYNVIEQIFVYCRFNCIDIMWFINQKMRYNELRPQKHGKVY